MGVAVKVDGADDAGDMEVAVDDENVLDVQNAQNAQDVPGANADDKTQPYLHLFRPPFGCDGHS